MAANLWLGKLLVTVVLLVRVTSNDHFDDHDGTYSSAQLALI